MYMGCHKCHFMAWLPLSCIVFIIVLLLIWFYCCKLYEYEYEYVNDEAFLDESAVSLLHTCVNFEVEWYAERCSLRLKGTEDQSGFDMSLTGRRLPQRTMHRWPLFCHHRSNAVEQSAWTASATGHHFRTVQTILENVYVWLVGLRRPVSER